MRLISLKCDNKSKHAILYPDDGIIEIKCDRSYCGARSGVVVLHSFNSSTGELVKTEKFSEPKGKTT